MLKRLFCCLTAAVLLCTVGACSQESLKRTGYETLHNYSDLKNAGDPAYDPPDRMSYDNYRQQRGLSLEKDGQGQDR